MSVSGFSHFQTLLSITSRSRFLAISGIPHCHSFSDISERAAEIVSSRLAWVRLHKHQAPAHTWLLLLRGFGEVDVGGMSLTQRGEEIPSAGSPAHSQTNGFLKHEAPMTN